MKAPRILCVVGATPNFMKIAPIMRAFAAHNGAFDSRLVHTGQHYDVAMNERFFQQLKGWDGAAAGRIVDDIGQRLGGLV